MKMGVLFLSGIKYNRPASPVSNFNVGKVRGFILIYRHSDDSTLKAMSLMTMFL